MKTLRSLSLRNLARLEDKLTFKYWERVDNSPWVGFGHPAIVRHMLQRINGERMRRKIEKITGRK